MTDDAVGAADPSPTLTQGHRLISYFVQGELTILQLETSTGLLALRLSPEVAAEVAHIIADGLSSLRNDDLRGDAGHILYPGTLEPLDLNVVPGMLGLEEQFIVQARSRTATQITFRLSPEKAKQWVADAAAKLARRDRDRRR